MSGSDKLNLFYYYNPISTACSIWAGRGGMWQTLSAKEFQLVGSRKRLPFPPLSTPYGSMLPLRDKAVPPHNSPGLLKDVKAWLCLRHTEQHTDMGLFTALNAFPRLLINFLILIFNLFLLF